MKLENKVAIITGAAGGIGSAACKLFAEEGAKVVMAGRTAAKLEKAAGELGLKPETYLVVEADVSKEEDVKKLFVQTMERFGKVDVIFNNAGNEGAIAPLGDYPIEVFDRVISINLRGTYLCMQYALNYMKETGGVIVNNSSIGGLKGMPLTSAYVASKFAINGLTKCAAVEYAKQNIRVNSVCPSPVETRMMRSIEAGAGADASAAKNAFIDSIPMGRYAEPEEVAKAALFLASDDASFVTGVTLSVDGGMFA